MTPAGVVQVKSIKNATTQINKAFFATFGLKNVTSQVDHPYWNKTGLTSKNTISNPQLQAGKL